MKHQRVAACMILGDAFDPEELRQTFRTLESGGIEAIFVAFNGNGDEEQIENLEPLLSIPLYIERFEWEEDFGKARQQSFGMVPKDEFDWLMWIDSDDILCVKEGTSLQEMFESLDEYSTGIFCKYEYAFDPEAGIVVVEQWRERFLRADKDWQWKHPIHEVCIGPPGTQFARRDNVYIRHLRKSGEDRGARPRNRRIISKAMREHPEESRYVFYFAGETMAEAESEKDLIQKKLLCDAAIQAFRRYQEMMPGLTDDFFLAQTRIAEAYRMYGDHISAIEADLEAIGIYPDWPDGYVGAAKSCMELGDFRRQKAFADIACKMDKPITAASIEPLMAGFNPFFFRGLANEQLGEFKLALEDYKKAQEYWNPPNGSLDQKIAELEGKTDIDGTHEDKWNERKKLRGTKPEKSIAFFTNPIFEPWHPKTLEKVGAGGAETCIMKLAPYFVRDGWRVAVFGTPGENRGVYEGIEYWSADEFLAQEKFTVFVSSRSPYPFQAPIQADVKILWMHDVNVGTSLEDVKDIPDSYIALTHWHKNHLNKLYGLDTSKIEVIGNGVDLTRFNELTQSDLIDDRPAFIWSSSYDRGLDTLLGMWPLIRRNWPYATLDIFYGWNMIDKAIQASRQAGRVLVGLEDLRDNILNALNLYKDEGVTEHGRINQNELADWMHKSSFWLYPTSFMETFCITAIEMQAAGVVPIASNLAGLKETVHNSDLLIEGWPLNVDYQRRFISTVGNVMGATTKELIGLRQEGKNFAEENSWENAYHDWTKHLLNLGVAS